MIFYILLLGLPIYTTYIALKYGVQDSISISYYNLREKDKWIFTVALWSFALPGAIILDTLLMLVASLGIIFVGGACHFVEKDAGDKPAPMAYWTHMIGSYWGVILSQAALWINFGYWYLTVLFVGIVLSMKLLRTNNFTWWVEVSAIGTVLIGIILKLVG